MHSERFGRPIVITLHARRRMQERSIDDELLVELVETGDLRYKDEAHLWIARAFADRHDNLVCAAVVIDDALVVKTVMHHFEWGDRS